MQPTIDKATGDAPAPGNEVALHKVEESHFGEAPLVEDNSVSHGSTSVVNLGVGYAVSKWTFDIEVLNLADAEDDDIAYYFESALAGELVPVSDVHFHPVIPRTLRLSVRYDFAY